MRPGAAREAEQQSADEKDHDREPAQPQPAGHEIDQQEQEREDQKRPIHIRVFERGADAIVGEKDIGAGQH